MKKWRAVAYVLDGEERIPRKEITIYADDKEDAERAARHSFFNYVMFGLFEEEEKTNEEVADSSVCGE